MIAALITKERAEVPPQYLEELEANGVQVRCKKCQTYEDLKAVAFDADVVWLYGRCVSFDAGALDLLPKCKAIFRSGSGMDAIPMARAKELGILCCNTPESISDAVAEHAASFILALAHQLIDLNAEVHRDFWDPSDKRMRYQVRRRTLGLVGYGLIGRTLERMMSGFQMKVLHYDPFQPESTPLPELLAQSDFVSLHCPLTPETRHSFGAAQFAQMKPTAFLINTSRGGVVDTPALMDAVKNHTIAGAALDVTEVEPLPAGDPLLSVPGIIITPHLAAMSADFEKDFWSCSVRKLFWLRDQFRNGKGGRA